MLQYESIEPVDEVKAAVIWLHGLGADGFDFIPVARELALPASLGMRFIFPHAPVMPVTINGGMQMRAWYDIYEANLYADKDLQGIRASSRAVIELVRRQVDSGLLANKIFLAGFSQGGVIALHAGLHCGLPLAGILALSCYAADVEDLNQSQLHTARHIPLLMMHGREDDVVLPQWGEMSRATLEGMGLNVEWEAYDMPHAVIPQQILDIANWFRRCLA